MKDSLKQQLTTAGVGSAAGAAGFAAAKGLGSDTATSATVGAGVGLTAALLAAIINRKVSQRSPLMSPTNAAVASAAGGAGIGLASLTGMNALSDNAGYKAGVNKVNDFILDLATKPDAPIQNALGKSLLDLGRLPGRPAKWKHDAPWIKNVFNAARRHKRIGASALLGLASTPFIYSALRGNGSD